MFGRKDIVSQEEKNRELNRQLETIIPAVNIYENNDELLLYADMPGVNKNDIKLNIDNGTLSLQGIRKIETKGSAQWEEFGDIEYQRSFSIPQAISIEQVNAEHKDGVLKLHLPKSEAAKPRQIEIKAG